MCNLNVCGVEVIADYFVATTTQIILYCNKYVTYHVHISLLLRAQLTAQRVVVAGGGGK